MLVTSCFPLPQPAWVPARFAPATPGYRPSKIWLSGWGLAWAWFMLVGSGSLLAILSVAVPALAQQAFPNDSSPQAVLYPRAQEFVLKDQYNKTHAYNFPKDKISVLLFADYAGSAQLEDWIRPIYARYQHAIAIHGVAELSAVPGLMRGMVRAAFRGQVQYPVMLDWRGTVSASYDYQSSQANVFVIDTQGDIVLKVVGAITSAKLQRVLTQVDRLLLTTGD
jgi:hypothetical protein